MCVIYTYIYSWYTTEYVLYTAMKYMIGVVLPDLSASNTQTLGSKTHCLDNYGKHLNDSSLRSEVNLI